MSTLIYLKNLRDLETDSASNVPDLLAKQKNPRPAFKSKAEFRDWCSNQNTDHIFYSTAEGDSPHQRISASNPVRTVHGIVADYDAPVDWGTLDQTLMTNGTPPPNWRSRTFSDYCRAYWKFEEPLVVTPGVFPAFMAQIRRALRLDFLIPGFDENSIKANQYFEVGTDWKELSPSGLPHQLVTSCLFKAAAQHPEESADGMIPLEEVQKAVEEKYPGRWPGEFTVGARGPLFWIDDGVTREGCLVCEDGMLCFSTRAPKGFMSWRDIFGSSFVDQFLQKKTGNLLHQFWFNGKNFYRMLHGSPMMIPKDQLVLDLRRAGFCKTVKKGQALSELETAILFISEENRVDEIAPVVFSKEKIVQFNGNRILNTANIVPVQPNGDGSQQKWPFLHHFLHQLFHNPPDRPAVDYFFSWLQRFYQAVLDRELVQGQALLLVGPTNRGKSLLSNRVIAGLVGGYADASDYLSGKTKFNKDLGRVAAWVIDDTTSAASFQDQRKATELIKRTVANPRMEHHAKYVDALSLPWAGRVVLSLNMDPNSLSVIPALDSSNRDKLLALRVAESATSKFPANAVVEKTIKEELPHFGRWLLESWKIPEELEDFSRFGVKSYIDESIASAAYDNSTRSVVAEWVECFVKHYRRACDNRSPFWRGTLTDFRLDFKTAANENFPGGTGHLEFFRRGMLTLEEACRNNPGLRPVSSIGSGGGKVWTIDLDPKYDLNPDIDATGKSNAGINP